MILKQLRMSRRLSQEHLADMSGLSVRTIQRIESGKNASVESLKCLASALEVEIATLEQETFIMNKSSDNWKQLPFFLKLWFTSNFFQTRPTRGSALRVEILSHLAGFLACAAGLVNEAALGGGLILLLNGYFTRLLLWQGDKYGIWFDEPEAETSNTNHN